MSTNRLAAQVEVSNCVVVYFLEMAELLENGHKQFLCLPMRFLPARSQFDDLLARQRPVSLSVIGNYVSTFSFVNS